MKASLALTLSLLLSIPSISYARPMAAKRTGASNKLCRPRPPPSVPDNYNNPPTIPLPTPTPDPTPTSTPAPTGNPEEDNGEEEEPTTPPGDGGEVEPTNPPSSGDEEEPTNQPDNGDEEEPAGPPEEGDEGDSTNPPDEEEPTNPPGDDEEEPTNPPDNGEEEEPTDPDTPPEQPTGPKSLAEQLFPQGYLYAFGFTTAADVVVPGILPAELDDKELNVIKVTANLTHNVVEQAGKSAWEAIYPAGSYKPSANPRGGFGFYLGGTDEFKAMTDGGADEVIVGYSVLFPDGFNFVKGGKLPGACECIFRRAFISFVTHRVDFIKSVESATFPTAAQVAVKRNAPNASAFAQCGVRKAQGSYTPIFPSQTRIATRSSLSHPNPSTTAPSASLLDAARTTSLRANGSP